MLKINAVMKASPRDREMEIPARSIPPENTGRERTLLVQKNRPPLMMTSETPQRRISDIRGGWPTTRLTRKRCSNQPIANSNGIEISNETSGLSPASSCAQNAVYAPRIIRSP